MSRARLGADTAAPARPDHRDADLLHELAPLQQVAPRIIQARPVDNVRRLTSARSVTTKRHFLGPLSFVTTSRSERRARDVYPGEPSRIPHARSRRGRG